jgi:cation transporter-like permease
VYYRHQTRLIHHLSKTRGNFFSLFASRILSNINSGNQSRFQINEIEKRVHIIGFLSAILLLSLAVASFHSEPNPIIKAGPSVIFPIILLTNFFNYRKLCAAFVSVLRSSESSFDWSTIEPVAFIFIPLSRGFVFCTSY